MERNADTHTRGNLSRGVDGHSGWMPGWNLETTKSGELDSATVGSGRARPAGPGPFCCVFLQRRFAVALASPRCATGQIQRRHLPRVCFTYVPRAATATATVTPTAIDFITVDVTWISAWHAGAPRVVEDFLLLLLLLCAHTRGERRKRRN